MGQQSAIYTHKCYQFCEWKVIPDANELVRNNEVYTIEPRLMRALCVLIEHQQRVIDREQLIKAVWPDNVIVSDHSVTQLLGSLRKVLQDSARNPKYIQTIPKRGYRFIAECQSYLPDNALNSTADNAIDNAAKTTVNSAAQTVSRNHSEPDNVNLADKHTISNDTSEQTNVEATTTGALTSFDSTRDASTELLIDSDSIKPYSTRQNRWLFVLGLSFVALISTLIYQLSPETMPVDTAVEHTSEANQTAASLNLPSIQAINVHPITNSPGVERFPSVSPNGKWLVFSWEDYQTDTNLYLKSLDFPQKQRVQLTFDNARELRAVWSPDGNHIAFARFTGETECALITLNITTREQQYVAQCHTNQFTAESIAWGPDNALYFKAPVSDNQRVGLSRYTLPSKTLTHLPCRIDCDFDDMDISVAPNNKYLVVTRQVSLAGQDLFLYQQDYTQKEQRLTHDGVQILGHTFSLDSNILYYVTLKAGEPGLWAYHMTDGTHFAVDLGSITPTYPTIYASEQPNEAHLIFTRQERQFYISQVKLSEDDPRQSPIVQSYASNFDPAMSAASQTLAYTSGISGRSEIWLMHIDSMKYEQLTESNVGSLSPAWSTSGEKLVYVTYATRETPQLVVYDRKTQQSHEVHTPLNAIWGPQFANENTLLISGIHNQDSQHKRYIWSVDIQSGEVTRESSVGGFIVRADPADAQSILFTKQQQDGLWHKRFGAPKDTLLIPELQDMHIASWVATTDSIYFVVTQDEHDVIKQFDRTTGKTTSLVSLPKKSVAQYTTGGLTLRDIDGQAHLLFVHNGVLQADILGATIVKNTQK